jgi:hypothetical protein
MFLLSVICATLMERFENQSLSGSLDKPMVSLFLILLPLCWYRLYQICLGKMIQKYDAQGGHRPKMESGDQNVLLPPVRQTSRRRKGNRSPFCRLLWQDSKVGNDSVKWFYTAVADKKMQSTETGPEWSLRLRIGHSWVYVPQAAVKLETIVKAAS